MLEQIKLEDKPQKEYDRLTNPKEGWSVFMFKSKKLWSIKGYVSQLLLLWSNAWSQQQERCNLAHGFRDFTHGWLALLWVDNHHGGKNHHGSKRPGGVRGLWWGSPHGGQEAEREMGKDQDSKIPFKDTPQPSDLLLPTSSTS
jgi:hypothetical protein